MRFRFVMGRAFHGFFSNFAMTFAVILVTFVSLLFAGTGLLSQLQIQNMKEHWYAKVEVSVYMCAEGDSSPNCDGKAATQEEIQAVREQLESAQMDPYVSEIHFQDKQEAYRDFKEQFADTVLAEATTPDMLPEAFRVKLKDPTQYKAIANSVEGMPGVQSVQDQQKILEPLFNVINKATVVSFSLAGVMVLAAVLLMTTAIRLSAMLRAKETLIMRFVGASNLFIQLPFMIETAIAALIGALLAIGTLAIGVRFGVEQWLQANFRFLGSITVHDVWVISPIIIIAAIVFAAIASMISLAKYTKA